MNAVDYSGMIPVGTQFAKGTGRGNVIPWEIVQQDRETGDQNKTPVKRQVIDSLNRNFAVNGIELLDFSL